MRSSSFISSVLSSSSVAISRRKAPNLPLALVRVTIEITVVSIGWYLGGVVGIGTLLFAFGIGPTVALGLFITEKIF